jgi:hypothetical protein
MSMEKVSVKPKQAKVHGFRSNDKAVRIAIHVGRMASMQKSFVSESAVASAMYLDRVFICRSLVKGQKTAVTENGRSRAYEGPWSMLSDPKLPHFGTYMRGRFLNIFVPPL